MQFHIQQPLTDLADSNKRENTGYHIKLHMIDISQFWGVWTKFLLPLLPGQLWLGVEARIKIPSIYNFFHATFVSILLYGCTTWTLKKCIEKKLGGSCTRMLWAILNKSCMQHPTKQQLYGHLTPISKPIQIRRTKTYGTPLEEQGRTHKRRSPMGPFTRTRQCKTTS